jgi:hypothetical protein
MINTSRFAAPGHDDCIETRFVLARCPAKEAHALQELIRAFQTDFPAPNKRKRHLRKKVLKTLAAPVRPDAIRRTLARLGITRLVETPASA